MKYLGMCNRHVQCPDTIRLKEVNFHFTKNLYLFNLNFQNEMSILKISSTIYIFSLLLFFIHLLLWNLILLWVNRRNEKAHVCDDGDYDVDRGKSMMNIE